MFRNDDSIKVSFTRVYVGIIAKLNKKTATLLLDLYSKYFIKFTSFLKIEDIWQNGCYLGTHSIPWEHHRQI